MAQERKIVYVKPERCSIVNKKQVLVEDAVSVFGNDRQLVEKLKKEILLTVPDGKSQKFAFSVLRLFEILSMQYKDVEWVNVGEDEFIVEYKPPKKMNLAWEVLKTTFVCFAVFFGAAFTIMTFNQDVAVADVFRMMEDLVIGPEAESQVIEIAYSIGLPIGVILFFNHFSRRKMDSDPTPLQVQMRLYEENVNKTVIENASREGNLRDAR